MDPEEVKSNFTEGLVKLREPYLKVLAPDTDEEGGDEQDLGKLSEMEEIFGVFHKEIGGMIYRVANKQPAVEEGGNALDKHSLYMVFEKKGVFTALEKDPSLKDDLMQILHLLLIEYPFTRSVSHINKVRRTPSYQIEIIPNTV
jgi:hypothetical protein